jgi:membrane protease YdiL (CAAX protease family)
MTPALAAVGFLQLALLLAGLRVLWTTALAPAARARARGPQPLPRWGLPLPDFVTAGLMVVGGGLVFQIGIHAAFRAADLYSWIDDEELAMVLQGAMFQFGLLAGAGLAAGTVCRRPEPRPEDLPAPASRPLVAGLLTFLAALPVVTALNLAWQGVLSLFEVEAPPQELVFMMVEAESPLTSAILIGFAVVVAPLAEEIVFRAGFFRYLRTRVPRVVAYVVPAAIFGALHGNLAAFVPLTTLAVVFAIAYERTGRLAVPIVAHALFNLNTVVLLFAGVAI